VLAQTLGQVHELAPDRRHSHDCPPDPLLPPLDLLPQAHLLLGVQERDAADLTEVEADRILRTEAFLGWLVLFLGPLVILLRRGAGQVVLGLNGLREIEAMKDLLHLVGRNELAGLVRPFLGLGLSNSGHSHRGAAVMCTTLQHLHLPPVTGTPSTPLPNMRRTRPSESFHVGLFFKSSHLSSCDGSEPAVDSDED
jgi:hypothetical protein